MHPRSVFTFADSSHQEPACRGDWYGSSESGSPRIPTRHTQDQHVLSTFYFHTNSFTLICRHLMMKALKLSKSVIFNWSLWKVLSSIEGPDGAKVAEMMKCWRKIPMIEPGFEPRNIEMKVGRSILFTIRTPLTVLWTSFKKIMSFLKYILIKSLEKSEIPTFLFRLVFKFALKKDWFFRKLPVPSKPVNFKFR